jgi:excinuclease ABC A subunit
MSILEEVGKVHAFSIDTPFSELSEDQKKIIFKGAEDKEWNATWTYQTKTRQGTQELKMTWEGIYNYLMDEYYKTRKNKNIKNLVDLLSYEECSNCSGSGLIPERLSIRIAEHSIHDIKSMNFDTLQNWINENDDFDEVDQKLIDKIKPHLINTIERAQQLHIDHLQLNRKSPTLSGGENQRIELIKQLNSPLTGVTYLLDEPSAGLSYDNIPDLIEILKELVQKGNTVLVIEHNKEIIQSAEYIVELGPKAGRLGGNVIFDGSIEEMLAQPYCHPFLKKPTKKVQLELGKAQMKIKEVSRHTLVRDELTVPLGGVTAITGKSGIGKTTLVKEVILPSIKRGEPVNCKAIQYPKQYSDVHYFESKKLRTHAATLLVDYLDLLKEVTKVFAKETGLKTNYFSYKTKGSQCPRCKGKGFLETSLDITANHIEKCEECEGRRYKVEVLDHQINSRNIAEILNFNIRQFKDWLKEHKWSKSAGKQLNQLTKIGLDHLTLDQTVQSLSSGEQQRLLLLNWLQEQTENELYILDEPSIGLHYADIDLLYEILEELGEKNDILVIEHNPYLLEKIGIGMRLT